MTLPAWRTVVEPHPDVSAGRYRQSEFAADLAQVLEGTAEAEYGDAKAFFERTYITRGIAELLKTAFRRLASGDGDPVMQLKTAFGGGKTHSMLALLHVVRSGRAAVGLAGIEPLLRDVGLKQPPAARIAVLVGSALDATRPVHHATVPGGEVRTLWGELARQLGGEDRVAEAFDYVAAADATGRAPSSTTFARLFDAFGSCVVLIDELVAYVRNLKGRDDLPGGTFDAAITFVHAVTEGARRSKSSMVIASLPESEVELGGDAGREALRSIEPTFGRIETIWRPVGASEGFEIVRRRLFGEIHDIRGRDRVVDAYASQYREAASEFPSDALGVPYRQRLHDSFPIHPEVFDRLYEDWGSLERFQRTRGVLRLMAAVVHELWASGDQSPLITPSTFPLHAEAVRSEMLRYLPEGWNSVVDADVDGDRSVSRRIDDDNPRFGRVRATRRVARAIFLGSAPSAGGQAARGIESSRIRLGTVAPDETTKVFDDALDRLSKSATHLYFGGERYWFDLQPNLRRTVEDRAARLHVEHDLLPEIEQRLRQQRERSVFGGIHFAASSADVVDDDIVRLVVLPPSATYSKSSGVESAAQRLAYEVLTKRGSAERINRNCLLFLASDGATYDSLLADARQYLAWASVLTDGDVLNLDTHGRRQAQEQAARADAALRTRIQESYQWLLVPVQSDRELSFEVQQTRGSDPMIERAGQRAVRDQVLVTRWSAELLEHELDKWGLWRDADHLAIRDLWGYFARYPYLSRLRDAGVLLDAITDGVRTSRFAYATARAAGGYADLALGHATNVQSTPDSLIVKPEVARDQRLSGSASQPSQTNERDGADDDARLTRPTDHSRDVGGTSDVPDKAVRRYWASVEVDPSRLARNLGDIANEVVIHLRSLPNASVRVTVDIDVEVPGGIPQDVRSLVDENSNQLRFRDHGFASD
jgi:predicted AAA+ superfamily ATPase